MPPSIVLLAPDEAAHRQLEEVLRQGSVVSDLRRVTSLRALHHELEGRHADLIVADHDQVGCSALEVVTLCRDRHADVPVILVTGPLSDEDVLALIRAGAEDCVPRSRPAGLLPSVERALRHRAELLESRKAKEGLKSANLQLEAIAGVMTSFLESGSWRDACERLLESALNQTGSDRGLVGVVVDGRSLQVDAHRGFAWDTRRPGSPPGGDDPAEPEPPITLAGLDHLPGRVARSGQAVLSSGADEDPQSGPPWPASPPLTSFLGVPFTKGKEVLGVISVANRPGGYSTADQARLEALSRAASVLFDSHCRWERETDLREQLRQSQKMEAIGRLAGGVAHDFNNLLTVILGYGEALAAGLPASQPQRARLDQIRRAAERAAGLTRQLLAMSRRQVMQPRVMDANTVVADMGAMLRRLIGEHIQVVLRLEPRVWKVRADPAQLEQVIMNLVLNARDAMPGGGTLLIDTANVELDHVAGCQPPDRPSVGLAGAPRKTIDLVSLSGRWTRVTGKFRHLTTTQLSPYVQIGITDSGCGMDSETITRLFEPFFTTKELGKGTGLGLATVYGIVRQTGGHIAVESEPGRGTTFKIFLPRLQEADQTASTVDLAVPASRATETVLLVEDESQVRELVLTNLEEAGYRVLQASTGEEACQIGLNHPGPIDLLLTDVVMPRMSGRTLAELLLRQRPLIRVLYMSGYTDDILAPHGVLDPDASLLEKPFTTVTLMAKVRQVLESPGRGPGGAGDDPGKPPGGGGESG
ncbi:MAG: response regulator [Candidatus Riflebacteria bacterium]|nr:response regulator [Candidatus Riflebacteria bacterium]